MCVGREEREVFGEKAHHSRENREQEVCSRNLVVTRSQLLWSTPKSKRAKRNLGRKMNILLQLEGNKELNLLNLWQCKRIFLASNYRGPTEKQREAKLTLLNKIFLPVSSTNTHGTTLYWKFLLTL